MKFIKIILLSLTLILISILLGFTKQYKQHKVKIKYINCLEDYPSIGDFYDFEITPNYRGGGLLENTSANFKDSVEFYLKINKLVPDSMRYSKIYLFDPSIYVNILEMDTTICDFHISRIGYVLYKGKVYFPNKNFNAFICRNSNYRGCFCN